MSSALTEHLQLDSIYATGIKVLFKATNLKLVVDLTQNDQESPSDTKYLVVVSSTVLIIHEVTKLGRLKNIVHFMHQ